MGEVIEKIKKRHKIIYDSQIINVKRKIKRIQINIKLYQKRIFTEFFFVSIFFRQQYQWKI